MSEPSPSGGGEGYEARDDEGPLRHSSGGFNNESQTVREAPVSYTHLNQGGPKARMFVSRVVGKPRVANRRSVTW